LVVDGHPAHKANVVKSYIQSLKGRLELYFLVTVHGVNRNIGEEMTCLSEQGIRKNPATEKERGAH